MRVLPVKMYSIAPKRYNNSYKKQENEKQTSITSTLSYKNQFLGGNLVSFKGMPCSTGNFPMKKVYRLECPSCGQVMLTNKQVNSFANKTSDKKGSELQEALLEKMPYYREVERVISEEIIELLNDYPEADLKTATALLAADAKVNLESSQRKILSEMREESKKLPDDKRKDIETALDTAEEKIQKSNQDTFFKRKEFIKSIEAIRDKYESADNENEIKRLNRMVKMAQEMPNSKSNKNAFYVKYSRNRSNEEIARRLVLPSIVTTEHVQAHSKGGENNTANYIPMCGECNSRRGNMPYSDWFKIHPEMPENLQKYIDSVSQMIFDGTLDDDEYLETYIDEIIYAISNATNGELELKRPDSKTLQMHLMELERKEKQEILAGKIDKVTNALTKARRTKTKLEGDEEYIQMVQWAKQTHENEQNPETNTHPPYETVEDIEEKIKEKTKLLDKSQKLKKRCDSLNASTRSSQDLDERLEKLNQKISEIESRMAKRAESTDFTSKQSMDELESYDTCSEKLRIINSINAGKFQRTFYPDKKGEIDPIFILNEIREQYQIRLAELSMLPSVLQRNDETELGELKQKRIALKNSIEIREKQLAELKDVSSELKEIGCDTNKTHAEIKALKKRRTQINFKLKNIHIDDYITQLEQKLKELKKEYDSI